MASRKNELTSKGIDREWPHQVALPADYRQYMILHRVGNGWSVCPRHQTYYKDRREFIVYCFKEKSDAQLFQMHFDGELMTPETRPPKYPKMPKRAT